MQEVWKGNVVMTLTEQQALERLCDYTNLNFKTQKEAANSFGVSAQFMSAVLIGKKRMTKAMMGRLNITRRMVYLEPTSHANTGAAPVDAKAIRAEALAEQNSPDWLYDPTTGKPITDHIASTGKMVAEPVKQEPVATKQLPDPYDDRDGVWFDAEGLQRLKALPAGTKLYAAPVQPVKQEPVAYLDNGTRFKVTLTDRDCYIKSLPRELGGKWVALVAAEDDCHLKAAPVQPVLEPVELTDDEFLAKVGYQHRYAGSF